MTTLASSVARSSIGNNFWNLDCMKTDQLNADIWEQSPDLQKQIQCLHPVLSVGSAGAQQAIIDGEPDTVLPWVPDLVGEDWEDESSAEWAWQRIIRSKACRVVALGTIAEHGLLRLFASHGMQAFVQCQPEIRFDQAQVTNSTNWPLKYAGRLKGKNWRLGDWYSTDSFWVIEGKIEGKKRTWYLRPTNHPASVSSESHPSFAATRSALTAMERMTPQAA